MVALSLIFAIQEYKPYCFYVFDEIDAALDKHNSELLAALIKKYMTTGQYIIITHNDTLISEASNLYGVSMQENTTFCSPKLPQARFFLPLGGDTDKLQVGVVTSLKTPDPTCRILDAEHVAGGKPPRSIKVSPSRIQRCLSPQSKQRQRRFSTLLPLFSPVQTTPNW